MSVLDLFLVESIFYGDLFLGSLFSGFVDNHEILSLLLYVGRFFWNFAE